VIGGSYLELLATPDQVIERLGIRGRQCSADLVGQRTAQDSSSGR
jgi:hypothetical protein